MVIPGGASQGVWVATKVNNQSLQLCGAIDAQNKPLASCNASNKFTMRFEAIASLGAKILPGAFGNQSVHGWTAALRKLSRHVCHGAHGGVTPSAAALELVGELASGLLSKLIAAAVDRVRSRTASSVASLS